MKVYTEVVIDMQTETVLHENFFDYQGPAAECKGGDSGGGIDEEYNARMASIAEAQQIMAEELHNLYMSGSPEGGLPGAEGSQLGLEQSQIAWDQSLIDAMQGYESDSGSGLLDLQATQMGNTLQNQIEQIGSMTDPGIWGPGGSFYGEQAETSKAKMEAERSGFDLEQQYLDEATGLGLGQSKAEAQSTFLEKAGDIDPNDWAARGQTDVAASYAGTSGIMRRDATRMGLNPNSGKFADTMSDLALNRAKDIAAAREQNRRAGERERFRQLGLAAKL